MSHSATPATSPISYKDAGVDIDAGDALVERIKPLAKKTMREGVMAGIGGFGALFEVPKRYQEPVLVSGTDGVGTKLKLVFEWNMHDTVGIDLVAMSGTTCWCKAPSRCSSSIISPAASWMSIPLQPWWAALPGLRTVGLRLIGGETAEMPGMYPAGEYDLAGFAVGAVENQNPHRQNVAAGDVVWAWPPAACIPTALAWWCIERRAPAPQPRRWDGKPSKEAIMEPTRLYVKNVLARWRSTPSRPWRTSPVAACWKNIPRVLPEGLAATCKKAAGHKPSCSPGCKKPLALTTSR